MRQDERAKCIVAVCHSCGLGISHARDEQGPVWHLHDNTHPDRPYYHPCVAGPLWHREALACEQHRLLCEQRYGVSGAV